MSIGGSGRRSTWSHQAKAEPRDDGTRRRRGEAGETLIETLVSVTLTGLLVVAVLGGLFAAVRASVVQREAATAEVVVRNFAEALNDMAYAPCATTASYQFPPAFQEVDGFTVDVDDVERWVQDSNPTTFEPMPVLCDTDPDAADTGLQKVSYTVTATSTGKTRTHSLLKSISDTDEDLDDPLPAGAVRCNVVASRDTFIDEAAPGTSAGSAVSMDVAGESGAQRRSLLQFDLRPDAGLCGSGKTVPSGMKVVSASLRIYTWNVSGSPDCATECKHGLRRLTGDWTEAGATWANRPTGHGDLSARFKHGTGTGDLNARYQTIASAGLRDDVATFYLSNDKNFGWAIEQDCGTSGLDCTAPAPGFQVRTREWRDPRQQPTLSVVFAPDDVDTAGGHLRNIAYGTCASIRDGNYGNNSAIVANPCAGRRNQLWNHPPAGSGAPSEQLRIAASKACMEAGNPGNAGAKVFVWTCNNATHQKWEKVGTAVRYKANPLLCMAVATPKAGAAVVIQPCDGSAAQQWLFEAPPPSIPEPNIRLTSLRPGADPTAGPDCADVDVPMSASAPNGSARWAQTFPCMGESYSSQAWNLLKDGRLVNRRNSEYCLASNPVGGKPIVATVPCTQAQAQLWEVDGTRFRNLDTDKCLTSNGGRQWLTLLPCGSGAEQGWQLDPADAPASVSIMQIRNTRYDDCLDIGNNVANGADVSNWTCGSPDRAGQRFIKLSTNELVSYAQPNLCLTSGNAGARLKASTCFQINENNAVPANPNQQWLVTETNQLQRPSPVICAQANGNFGFATAVACATSGAIDHQQWNLEQVGTSSAPTRQLRNVQTGSCADVRPDTEVISWPCSGPDRAIQGVLLAMVGSQYEIRSGSNSTKCLEVQSSGNEGAAVRVSNCNFSNNQRWVTADGQLKTVLAGGRCLQGSADMARLTLATCTTSDLQKWTFTEQADERNFRQIRNTASQTCLDINGTPAQSAQFTGFPCNAEGRPNQLFVQLNNGAFASATNNANLCIDSSGNVGNPVLLWGCKSPVDSHHWATDDGYFKQVKFGRCAEFIPGTAGATMQTCTPLATRPYQQWVIEAPDTVAASLPVQFRSVTSTPNRAATCLDVSGKTRPTLVNNDPLLSFPCLGTLRTNQSFNLMSNGQIRSTTSPGMCFDAASTAGGTRGNKLVLYGCKDSADQYWRIDGGRIMNVTKTGMERRCLQVGADGTAAALELCSSNPDQQWVQEPIGATVRTGAVGRIRQTTGDLCLETVFRQQDAPLGTWGWSCDNNRPDQQRFVRLNSGQYRPVANLGFCLDSHVVATQAEPNPQTVGCVSQDLPQQPRMPDPAGQRWTLEVVTGWLRAANSPLCVGSADYEGPLRLRTCAAAGATATDPTQRWTFTPEAGL